MRNVASLTSSLIVGATLLMAAIVASPSQAAGPRFQVPSEATPEASPAPLMPAPSPSPAAFGIGPYRAKSPEYGMNIFIWANPSTTDRDLGRVRDAGFTWQKSLFKWRDIEPQRGVFDFAEADRIVRASAAAGVKIIARLDFQPTWARRDGAHNGPPDNYDDFGRFVTALVQRYRLDSPIGPIHAIEVWNEPNLAREWGGAPINEAQAGDYVRLMKTAYEATKAVDPGVVIISAGLSPTGWSDDTARPDDQYLEWMYAAGARDYFDVLGAHGPGFKAPPDVSPEEAATSPLYGGHRSFTFRRVEDLRAIMERNGDANKQVWLLEFGWTSDTVNQAYAWHRVSEEEKGEYLVAAYRWAHQNWAPWIGVMALWTLPDPGWPSTREELWWSVGNQDGTDRPALTRLREARRSGDLP